MMNVHNKGKVSPYNPYAFSFGDDTRPSPTQARQSTTDKENQLPNIEEGCRPHDKPFDDTNKKDPDDFNQSSAFQLIV